MIWIVSSSVAGTDENLSARHEYIELVSQAHVSPWQKHVAEADRDGYIKPIVEYYQCRSENGEYGIVLTAHIDCSIRKCITKRDYLIMCQQEELSKATLLAQQKSNEAKTTLRSNSVKYYPI